LVTIISLFITEYKALYYKALTFVEQALWTAYRDDDEMWIAGIARLMEKDNIKQQDFKNPETYDLLKYRDF